MSLTWFGWVLVFVCVLFIVFGCFYVGYSVYQIVQRFREKSKRKNMKVKR